MSKIEEAFRGLGRTEKVRFISQNIEYANAVAVASYVKVIFSMSLMMSEMMSI